MNTPEAITAQECDQERAMTLLMALDECKARGVSLEALKVLVYETGAGALVGKGFINREVSNAKDR